jgi:hypothetical protein
MPRRRHKLPAIDNLKTWFPANVTPQQLADYWLVHPETIQRWLRTGDLVGTRFRGAWRVKTDDARTFELRHRMLKKSA